jgi:hypothetical protein
MRSRPFWAYARRKPGPGRDRDHCRASPEINGDEFVQFAFHAADEVGAAVNAALIVIGHWQRPPWLAARLATPATLPAPRRSQDKHSDGLGPDCQGTGP